MSHDNSKTNIWSKSLFLRAHQCTEDIFLQIMFEKTQSVRGRMPPPRINVRKELSHMRRKLLNPYPTLTRRNPSNAFQSVPSDGQRQCISIWRRCKWPELILNLNKNWCMTCAFMMIFVLFFVFFPSVFIDIQIT